jgi:L-lysine 6-transaminase
MTFFKHISLGPLKHMLDAAIEAAPHAGRHIVETHTSAAESVPILIDLDKSYGARLYDRRRNTLFLDFHGGFGSDTFGRNSPVFQTPEATRLLLQMAQNKTAHSDFSTTGYVACINLIWNHYVQLLGPTFTEGHLHLIDGGSMAMNQAIAAAIGTKVAQNKNEGLCSPQPLTSRYAPSNRTAPIPGEKQYPLGQMVISFGDSFHGRDGLTASLSKGSYKLEALPKLPFVQVDTPKSSEPTEIDRCLAQLESEARRLGPDLAAVVIEDAIQCEGGDNHLPRQFYEGIRRIADHHNFFVIYDGVQTGFYSSGDPAAFLTIGSPPPDIYVTGKKTSVGCVIANTKIAHLPDNAFKSPGKLDSTFGGDSACIARFAIAAAVMQIPAFKDPMAGRYHRLAEGLRELATTFPNVIKGTRQMGALLTIDTMPHISGADLIQAAFDNHLLLLQTRNPNIVRLRPNLNIQDDEIIDCLAALQTACKTLTTTPSVTPSDTQSEFNTTDESEN